MIQHHEIDELRRIFGISGADIFDDVLCDVLHLLLLIPEIVK